MVGTSVAELSRLAGELAAESDVACLPDGVLTDELLALRGVIDRVEASFARRLAAVDRRGLARSDGCVSTVAWLRRRAGMTANAASERVRVARQLGHLEATSEGFASGRLTYGHVAVIARAAADVGPRHAAAAEPVLLEAAGRMDPDRLRRVAARLRHCVDPDGAQAGANRAHERRRLHVSETMDGLVVLDGLLDPESGTMVRRALEAVTAPPNPDDRRCAAQRRADALTELCGHALDTGRLPTTGGVRPHLNLTASTETLAGTRCSPDTGRTHVANDADPDAGPDAVPGDPSAPRGASEPGVPGGPSAPGGPSRPGGPGAQPIDVPPPAETENGHPLPHESLRRLACDATLTRVLLDPYSQPLDVGRATRTVPPALRRALNTRDGGCRYPGCDRPPSWTDAHHLTLWADGGPTALHNLVLLCRPHHRMVHDHGWPPPEQPAKTGRPAEHGPAPRTASAQSRPPP